MNVLIFRNLNDATLTSLRTEFPSCTFRGTTDPGQFETWRDWPEVIFGNPPPLPLTEAHHLRWLQLISSGFEDYSALSDRPVTVTTAHGAHAPIIAQHVLLMFLFFVRGQLHLADRQRRHEWNRTPALPQDPAKLTVAIVGYGAVGREIVSLIQPMRPRLVALKRTPSSTPPELAALHPLDRLDDILSEADHVVLTLPLTTETTSLFDASRLARMKPGAILHNVGRGGLVDEAALIHALQTHHLGGAALDVFAQEPLPTASPLWDMPNVIVTPHLAGHHRDLPQLLLERFRANLRRYLEGHSIGPLADFARGY